MTGLGLKESNLQTPRSRVAQWKRAGPITQRSVDRNHALLLILKRFKQHIFARIHISYIMFLNSENP